MANTEIKQGSSAEFLSRRIYARKKRRLEKHRERILPEVLGIPLIKRFSPPSVWEVSQLGLDPIIVVRFEKIVAAMSEEQREELLETLRRIAGESLAVEEDGRYWHPKSADFIIKLSS